MPAIYDLMLLLDTTAPPERRAEIVGAAESQIVGGGELLLKQEWGSRLLAYEIEHRTEAEYHLLQFHGPASLLESLDRTLRITDGVVRFRIVKLAPGTPAAPDVRPEARPAAEGTAAEVSAPAEPAAPAAEAPAAAPAEPAAPAAEAPAADAPVEPSAAEAPAAADADAAAPEAEAPAPAQ